MIEGAAQATSEQKEAMYREAQAAKVIRNSRKLAQELDKVRIEETQKQLRHCLKQLALWEISVGATSCYQSLTLPGKRRQLHLLSNECV
ncbi:hypothetical protein P3D61_12065 [Pseudomonas aeruginosa]|uniref:hypothetical protein n=1 Tax=Pseudomonas aeruginosa TaxID=287 RepID=UPI001EDD523F|nr:hypothetical protein [Pseudomonas aeruginosa]